MYIPQRFIDAIDTHIIGNLLQIPDFPLILIIAGAPGTGKTYQLEHHLMDIGVSICSMSAVDMESSLSGEPVRILGKKYIEASDIMLNGHLSVLKIDDIDIMLGEWEKNTGTVNHQTLLAFLMHIADNPSVLSMQGKEMHVARVPIIVTGNYINKLYAPLVREGRANKFVWQPSKQEKIDILKQLSIPLQNGLAETLVDQYPSEEIAFFSSVIANVGIDELADITRRIVFTDVLRNLEHRDYLRREYANRIATISEDKIMKKAQEMRREAIS